MWTSKDLLDFKGVRLRLEGENLERAVQRCVSQMQDGPLTAEMSRAFGGRVVRLARARLSDRKVRS